MRQQKKDFKKPWVRKRWPAELTSKCCNQGAKCSEGLLSGMIFLKDAAHAPWQVNTGLNDAESQRKLLPLMTSNRNTIKTPDCAPSGYREYISLGYDRSFIHLNKRGEVWGEISGVLVVMWASFLFFFYFSIISRQEVEGKAASGLFLPAFGTIVIEQKGHRGNTKRGVLWLQYSVLHFSFDIVHKTLMDQS